MKQHSISSANGRALACHFARHYRTLTCGRISWLHTYVGTTIHGSSAGSKRHAACYQRWLLLQNVSLEGTKELLGNITHISDVGPLLLSFHLCRFSFFVLVVSLVDLGSGGQATDVELLSIRPVIGHIVKVSHCIKHLESRATALRRGS